MRIEVVHVGAEGRTTAVALDLKTGATVGLALKTAAVHPSFAGLDVAGAAVGVYGVLATPDQLLRDGDRVELYRPLLMDPKEARRRRAKGC